MINLSNKSNDQEATTADGPRIPVVRLNDELLWEPTSALRHLSIPIDTSSNKGLSTIRRVVREMFRSLAEDPTGVALAAPQLGILSRIVIVNFDDRDTGDRRLHVLVNPRITWSSESTTQDSEICLSVPNKMGLVTRKKQVKVEALDHQGKPVIIETQGFFARVLQHEIDHLDGKLYVDFVDQELEHVPDYPDRRAKPLLRRLHLD